MHHTLYSILLYAYISHMYNILSYITKYIYYSVTLKMGINKCLF